MENQSISRVARTAGIWYLVLGVFGIFGMVYVPSALGLYGEVAVAAENILASETLFRLGIVGRLITQVVQIFTVLALYHLLAPVNKGSAALMVILILMGVPIAMLNEITQFAVLFLLKSAEPTLSTVHVLLELHEHGVIIAHIFWGLWLLPMGYLVYKSGFLPKILGILLIIGGFGYLVDFFMATLVPSLQMTVSQFTFIGELALPIWLVVRGVNIEQWQKQTLENN